MEDDTRGEFTEVKASNWNKNNRNKPSSNTPIPTYYPTTPNTPWPTYTPTTQEDKAEWLRKKQKYLKNRDRVPDSVWESDEATVGKKKQAWLEKQKDKQNNKSDNESNTNGEEQNTEDQREEEGTSPTQTPTYYDPPVVPTRKQIQLDKREKLAAQKQNTTNNEARDSVTPSPAPTSSTSPTIRNTTAVQEVQEEQEETTKTSREPSISPAPTPTMSRYDGGSREPPTKKQKKEAAKLAQLAEEAIKTDEPSVLPSVSPSVSPSLSPTTNTVSATTSSSSRYSGGSREPPKSRKPPVARPPQDEELEDMKGDETDATSEEASEELEPEDASEKVSLILTQEELENQAALHKTNTNKNKDKKTQTMASEKVSLILTQEELEKQAALRDAPQPTRSPVEPTKTVKVNFTFINNRVKKRVTPAPTPVVTSGEPTYVLFPTIVPTVALTEPQPTYAPTAAWTWAPSVNKDRSRAREKSLFDKRTCPSDNLLFESELRTAEETGDSVFFTYGIQISKNGDIGEAVEKIQNWILEDVASKLLHCPKNDFVMRSNNDFGRNDEQGVLSSVYYSKDDRQYAKQCNPTTSEAKMCAIVSSTMRFDAVDQEVKARPKVLAVIFNQVQSGFDKRFEEANILDLAYLGPELGYHQPHDEVEVKDTPTSSSSAPTSAYAAIGVASFAVFALLLCLAMGYKLRKERRRPSSASVISSYR
eukprot:CAMPEP_0113430210 /NCGR_PEP_ID=MMETSP0013_2-20120614/32879_1 /TAXON_ID=2843 ORGANISM="Skeletonema costatum, Strain 1716" /NCGR_SAMPLE_ID=MMETSP0013_2 /ASSEMBLY_ACC=CAM_ASM_000158 /LENGTH=704 /DNA_ID=CAMNT_0000319019 /DNA_START=29 /DNA_END=2140 /DNA_ORIENTATION=+ /assembly_acc=CAM_ASM_000158